MLYIRIIILIAFIFNSLGISSVKAQEFLLPKPGVMVRLSPPMDPPVLKGIKVHPDNPFKFDFILDKGDPGLSSRAGSIASNEELKDESNKLIKYFLASLTIPERDLWVNLSPYEKDRIIPISFGVTEMGRDLLAEDYLLKQITASLIYPEDEVGKKFWKRIYEEAQKKYGTTNVPVNTFNKVWIVPEKAVVYENAKVGAAYVAESKLKVMLEEDYESLNKHTIKDESPKGITTNNDTHSLGSQIVREIVIPELTREINEGKNFAKLRQVYSSLILAAWYKKKIKDSILSQVYADKSKTQGVNIDDPQEKEKIYQQYLKAFKKGVYNYIKEDPDPVTGEKIPRKYFSGGVSFAMSSPGTTNLQANSAMKIEAATASQFDLVNSSNLAVVSSSMSIPDAAMANVRKGSALNSFIKKLDYGFKLTLILGVFGYFDYLYFFQKSNNVRFAVNSAVKSLYEPSNNQLNKKEIPKAVLVKGRPPVIAKPAAKKIAPKIVLPKQKVNTKSVLQSRENKSSVKPKVNQTPLITTDDKNLAGSADKKTIHDSIVGDVTGKYATKNEVENAVKRGELVTIDSELSRNLRKEGPWNIVSDGQIRFVASKVVSDLHLFEQYGQEEFDKEHIHPDPQGDLLIVTSATRTIEEQIKLLVAKYKGGHKGSPVAHRSDHTSGFALDFRVGNLSKVKIRIFDIVARRMIKEGRLRISIEEWGGVVRHLSFKEQKIADNLNNQRSKERIRYLSQQENQRARQSAAMAVSSDRIQLSDEDADDIAAEEAALEQAQEERNNAQSNQSSQAMTSMLAEERPVEDTPIHNQVYTEPYQVSGVPVVFYRGGLEAKADAAIYEGAPVFVTTDEKTAASYKNSAIKSGLGLNALNKNLEHLEENRKAILGFLLRLPLDARKIAALHLMSYILAGDNRVNRIEIEKRAAEYTKAGFKDSNHQQALRVIDDTTGEVVDKILNETKHINVSGYSYYEMARMIAKQENLDQEQEDVLLRQIRDAWESYYDPLKSLKSFCVVLGRVAVYRGAVDRDVIEKMIKEGFDSIWHPNAVGGHKYPEIIILKPGKLIDQEDGIQLLSPQLIHTNVSSSQAMGSNPTYRNLDELREQLGAIKERYMKKISEVDYYKGPTTWGAISAYKRWVADLGINITEEKRKGLLVRLNKDAFQLIASSIKYKNMPLSQRLYLLKGGLLWFLSQSASPHARMVDNNNAKVSYQKEFSPTGFIILSAVILWVEKLSGVDKDFFIGSIFSLTVILGCILLELMDSQDSSGHELTHIVQFNILRDIILELNLPDDRQLARGIDIERGLEYIHSLAPTKGELRMVVEDIFSQAEKVLSREIRKYGLNESQSRQVNSAQSASQEVTANANRIIAEINKIYADEQSRGGKSFKSLIAARVIKKFVDDNLGKKPDGSSYFNVTDNLHFLTLGTTPQGNKITSSNVELGGYLIGRNQIVVRKGVETVEEDIELTDQTMVDILRKIQEQIVAAKQSEHDSLSSRQNQAMKAIPGIIRKAVGNVSSDVFMPSDHEKEVSRAMNVSSENFINSSFDKENGVLIIEGKEMDALSFKGRSNIFVDSEHTTVYRVNNLSGKRKEPKSNKTEAFKFEVMHRRGIAPGLKRHGFITSDGKENKDSYYAVAVDYLEGDSLDNVMREPDFDSRREKIVQGIIDLLKRALLGVNDDKVPFGMIDFRPANIWISSNSKPGMKDVIFHDVDMMNEFDHVEDAAFGYRRNIEDYEYQSTWRTIDPDGKVVKFLNGIIKDRETEQSQVSSAMKTEKKIVQRQGGINFNLDKLNLQIRNSGEGGINFKLDPVMLQQLRNAPGFVPIIFNIQPMTDLKAFMGLTVNITATVHSA